MPVDRMGRRVRAADGTPSPAFRKPFKRRAGPAYPVVRDRSRPRRPVRMRRGLKAMGLPLQPRSFPVLAPPHGSGVLCPGAGGLRKNRRPQSSRCVARRPVSTPVGTISD